MTIAAFHPRFVDEIPEELDDGVLYISIAYAVMVHRCASGCGRECVNPLSPAQWSFTYDGANISVSPSIGNWSYPCRSHYWIRRGQVQWAPQWSTDEVRTGRSNDQRALDELHSAPSASATTATPTKSGRGWLRRLLRRI
jgi:hypothetical protein